MDQDRRMELLRMAMQTSADPSQAIALAQHMAAFVEGAPATPVPALPAPTPVPPKQPEPPEPVDGKQYPRGYCSYTNQEKALIERLFDEGQSLEDISPQVGRSVKGLRVSLNKGLVSPKTYNKSRCVRSRQALPHWAVATG